LAGFSDPTVHTVVPTLTEAITVRTGSVVVSTVDAITAPTVTVTVATPGEATTTRMIIATVLATESASVYDFASDARFSTDAITISTGSVAAPSEATSARAAFITVLPTPSEAGTVLTVTTGRTAFGSVLPGTLSEVGTTRTITSTVHAITAPTASVATSGEGTTVRTAFSSVLPTLSEVGTTRTITSTVHAITTPTMTMGNGGTFSTVLSTVLATSPAGDGDSVYDFPSDGASTTDQVVVTLTSTLLGA
jgi:hypothetical protein